MRIRGAGPLFLYQVILGHVIFLLILMKKSGLFFIRIILD